MAEAEDAGADALTIYDMPGHLVRRLNQVAVSIFVDEASRAGFDLTPVQYAALSTMERRPGLDQATLAGAIAYDRVTIGGVVDRLVQKGMAERQVSPQDRRARQLFVTPYGREVLRAIAPAVARVQDQLLSGLDAAERGCFLRLLQKATESVNALSRAPLRPPPAAEPQLSSPNPAATRSTSD